jgi:hypothetical protein
MATAAAGTEAAITEAAIMEAAIIGAVITVAGGIMAAGIIAAGAADTAITTGAVSGGDASSAVPFLILSRWGSVFVAPVGGGADRFFLEGWQTAEGRRDAAFLFVDVFARTVAPLTSASRCESPVAFPRRGQFAICSESQEFIAK